MSSPAGPAPRCFALIPCAGSGSRAGVPTPKQYEVVAGARLIDHTVRAFLAVPAITQVLVVLAPGDSVYNAPDERVLVQHVGGESRAHSVFNGLAALRQAGAQASDWVLVHDAARCLLTPAQIEHLLAACADDPVGGLLALPLPDTLKAAQGSEPHARVQSTLDRRDKWLAQTPQMFRWGLLHQALQQTQTQGFAGITDEASAVERLGWQPRLVRGSAQNFKVTYPEDFALAEAVLAWRQGHSPVSIPSV